MYTKIDLLLVAGYADFDRDVVNSAEYTNARPTSALVQLHARKQFLKSIEEHAPHLLDELRQLTGAPKLDLKHSIEKWAIEHHLVANGHPVRWIVLSATGFCLIPGLRGFPGVVASEWSGLTDDDTRIVINTSWDPRSEQPAAVKKRILGAVTQRMNVIQAKFPKGRTKKRASEHFTWLVRYQVDKISPKAIAAGPPSVELAAVRKALRETASILGLTLRLPPGRPKMLPRGAER
jgi:hypothetical protein